MAGAAILGNAPAEAESLHELLFALLPGMGMIEDDAHELAWQGQGGPERRLCFALCLLHLTLAGISHDNTTPVSVSSD